MTEPKPPKLTEADRVVINDMVAAAFLAGQSPQQIIVTVQKQFPAYSLPMLMDRLKKVKAAHRLSWKDTAKDTEANNQIAYLRYEILYAMAVEAKDIRTAMELLKLMGALLMKAQPESSQSRSRRTKTEQYGPEVTVHNIAMLCEDMDDEALEAELLQGQQTGSISVKMADQLIKKDHRT